jgi:septum formation protein
LDIVLASGSPRRASLLREGGVPAEVIVPDVSEGGGLSASPRETAALAARRKCRAVSSLRADAVVLAADTVIDLDGEALGKPRDLDDARRMLRALSGRGHIVLTAVCIERRGAEKRTAFVEESRVRFKTLAAEDIESYLAAVDVLDKAGAYAIQERADLLGARVEGSFSNVVGLPMKRVTAALRAMSCA